MDTEIYVIAFLIAFAGIVFSHIAGGGLSLITIPLYIFLGFDPRVAIASQKMGTIGSFTSIYKYIKAKKIEWQHMPFFILTSIVAAFLGSQLLIRTESSTVRVIFGGLLLLMLPFILLKREWGLKRSHHVARWKTNFGKGLFLIFSIIQSAFGAGSGMVMTFILVGFFGYPLINANATRRVPAYIMNVSAFIFMYFAGLVNIYLGLVIIFANFLGSYIGAHIAVKKGNPFVKIFFVIVVLLSGIKLLL